MVQSTYPAVIQAGLAAAVTDSVYSGSSLANAIAWAVYNQRKD